MLNTAYIDEARQFAALTGLNLENKDVQNFAKTMELSGFTREGEEEFGGVEDAARGYLAQGSKFFSDFRSRYEAAFVVEEESKLADLQLEIHATYAQLLMAVQDREGSEKIRQWNDKLATLEEEYRDEKKYLEDFKATLAQCGE